MLVALYFLLGLGLLYYGADYLVKGGANIALRLKVSPLVIGLTLVAYGTSAPELVVSIDSSLKGLGDVSLGNVVGSNICNIALIVGLCAVITPLRVNPKLLKFDMGVMIAAAAVLLGFYALNRGVDAMLGLPVPSDNAASRLAQEKMKSKLNGGIALIPGQGNQSQTYIRGEKR